MKNFPGTRSFEHDAARKQMNGRMVVVMSVLMVMLMTIVVVAAFRTLSYSGLSLSEISTYQRWYVDEIETLSDRARTNGYNNEAEEIVKLGRFLRHQFGAAKVTFGSDNLYLGTTRDCLTGPCYYFGQLSGMPFMKDASMWSRSNNLLLVGQLTHPRDGFGPYSILRSLLHVEHPLTEANYIERQTEVYTKIGTFINAVTNGQYKRFLASVIDVYSEGNIPNYKVDGIVFVQFPQSLFDHFRRRNVELTAPSRDSIVIQATFDFNTEFIQRYVPHELASLRFKIFPTLIAHLNDLETRRLWFPLVQPDRT